MARANCTACGKEFQWDGSEGKRLADITSPCCNAKAKGKTVRGPVNKRIGIIIPYEVKWNPHDEWRIPTIGKQRQKTLFTPTDDGLLYSVCTGHVRPVAPSIDGKYQVLYPPGERANLPIYRIDIADYKVLESLRKGVL